MSEGAGECSLSHGREPLPQRLPAVRRPLHRQSRLHFLRPRDTADKENPDPRERSLVTRAITGSWSAPVRVGRSLFRGRRGTRQVRVLCPSAPASLYVAHNSVVEPLLSLAHL